MALYFSFLEVTKMTGITIDHMVSLVAFFAVTLLIAGLFSQSMNTAITYQRNHQVALKASDVLNNILLSSGFPPDWGQDNSIPAAFGLHQPETGLLALSPFSLFRLIYPQNVVNYSGIVYSNISVAEGVSVFLPVARYVDYPTVSRLLSINGSYGLHVTIEPTLRVSIAQVQQYPLKLEANVTGPGGVCSGAIVDCYVYYANQSNPFIKSTNTTSTTEANGTAFLEFPKVDASKVTYSAVTQVHVGGLRGTGFYSSPLSYDSFIKPLIVDYKNKIIALVHRGDLLGTPPNSVANYSLTYVLPTQDYGFSSIQIENSSGIVKIGQPAYVHIPSFDPGILIISYRTTGQDFGTIMMPWGVSSLGISVDFGIDSSTSSWVATQLRQVIVGQISYQVRLALWSLTS
jgi:hypothetical protein